MTWRNPVPHPADLGFLSGLQIRAQDRMTDAVSIFIYNGLNDFSILSVQFNDIGITLHDTKKKIQYICRIVRLISG
jgi:hypothetical protein